MRARCHRRDIIRLATQSGAAIAEGETEQQLARLLVALGCDDAQGFHLAKPQPPDEGLRSRATACRPRACSR